MQQVETEVSLHPRSITTTGAPRHRGAPVAFVITRRGKIQAERLEGAPHNINIKCLLQQTGKYRKLPMHKIKIEKISKLFPKITISGEAAFISWRSQQREPQSAPPRNSAASPEIKL